MSSVRSKDHALAVAPAPAAAAAAASAGVPQPDGLGALSKADARDAAALGARLAADEADGARVMHFDEEATPEQKAAEARRKMQQIRPTKEENAALGEWQAGERRSAKGGGGREKEEWRATERDRGAL
jgi:hypothetical protein